MTASPDASLVGWMESRLSPNPKQMSVRMPWLSNKLPL